MQSKTKTSIWMYAAGAFVVALYFGPSIMNPIRNAILMRNPPSAPNPNAEPQKPQGPPAVPGTVTDPQTVAVFNKYEGIWRGGLALPSRGMCNVRFELHPLPGTPGFYTGLTSLICTPTVTDLLADKSLQTPAGEVSAMTKRMNPTSAILMGAITSGTIEYKVQKNLGVDQVQGGCAMTGLTAYPNGTQLAIDWKEEAKEGCKGGQVVLTRSSS